MENINNKFSQTRRRLEVSEMEIYSNVMKKILTFFYFLILFLNISQAQSEEKITVNTLMKEGYKLITEETISSDDTLVFNKVFTLRKKK